MFPHISKWHLSQRLKNAGGRNYLADTSAVFDEIEADLNMEKLWQAYQKNFLCSRPVLAYGYGIRASDLLIGTTVSLADI